VGLGEVVVPVGGAVPVPDGGAVALGGGGGPVSAEMAELFLYLRGCCPSCLRCSYRCRRCSTRWWTFPEKLFLLKLSICGRIYFPKQIESKYCSKLLTNNSYRKSSMRALAYFFFMNRTYRPPESYLTFFSNSDEGSQDTRTRICRHCLRQH
jgi:hypothetical protein